MKWEWNTGICSISLSPNAVLPSVLVGEELYYYEDLYNNQKGPLEQKLKYLS